FNYRKNGCNCGIAAEGTNGMLMAFSTCPGQESIATGEIPLGHLTTGQVAARLRVDSSSVIRLLASGKLTGTKINDQWRVPPSALREYMRELPMRRRAVR